MWEKTFLFVLVVFSFHLNAFGDPKDLLASLRKSFGNAYPFDYQQFAVLYFHKGDPKTDNLPTYDVQDMCNGEDVEPKIQKLIKNEFNVIKDKIAEWSTSRELISSAKPPIWPTLRPLLDNVCKGFHPNVATAGFDKDAKNLANNQGNAGHSEYYLLEYALQDMLESYIKNGEKKCPDAVFLYTVNTPCDSCKEIILKKKTNVLDKPCPKMPFYLGYTKEYTNSAKGWDEIEMWLTLNGITVIQVP